MSSSVSLSRNSERELRFQAAFLKKLPGIAPPPGEAPQLPARPGARSFPIMPEVAQGLFRPPHLTADRITKEMIANISSTKNKSVGLPIILFREGKFCILLTTSGVFFTPEGDTTGSFYWPELDFILTGDLASDTKLFRAERNIDLLVNSISYTDKLKKTAKYWTYGTIAEIIFSIIQLQSSWYGLLYLLLGAGLFVFSFFWVPVIAKIWLSVARANVRKNHFQANPDHYNLIIIGRLQKVHIGFTTGAENVILCMKLGLNIFRAQRRKYDGV